MCVIYKNGMYNRKLRVGIFSHGKLPKVSAYSYETSLWYAEFCIFVIWVTADFPISAGQS